MDGVKRSGVSTHRLNAWLDLVLLLVITILVAIMLGQWDMLGLWHSCQEKGRRNDGQNELGLFEDISVTGQEMEINVWCHRILRTLNGMIFN